LETPISQKIDWKPQIFPYKPQIFPWKSQIFSHFYCKTKIISGNPKFPKNFIGDPKFQKLFIANPKFPKKNQLGNPNSPLETPNSPWKHQFFPCFFIGNP